MLGRARGLSACDLENEQLDSHAESTIRKKSTLEKSNSFSSTILSSLAANDFAEDLGENKSFSMSLPEVGISKRQRKKAFDENEESCNLEF